MMKSTFRRDLPVPDTVWNIHIFNGVFFIIGFLLLFVALFFVPAAPPLMKWLYAFSIVCIAAFVKYAWKKRNESLVQRYEGIDSMNAEVKKKLLEEQTEYFQYQRKNALSVSLLCPLLALFLVFSLNALGSSSTTISPIMLLTYGWLMTIWRVVMSNHYLHKLKQTQQPV